MLKIINLKEKLNNVYFSFFQEKILYSVEIHWIVTILIDVKNVKMKDFFFLLSRKCQFILVFFAKLTIKLIAMLKFKDGRADYSPVSG